MVLPTAVAAPALDRWWISWWQPVEEEKLLERPWPQGLLGLWISGRAANLLIVCALFEGDLEVIFKKFSHAGDYPRFIRSVPCDWAPGGRFLRECGL